MIRPVSYEPKAVESLKKAKLGAKLGARLLAISQTSNRSAGSHAP